MAADQHAQHIADQGAPTASHADEVDSRLSPGNFCRIAKRARLSTSHVSRVLRGMRGVSLYIAARIAWSAGVSLNQMFDFIIRQPDFTIISRPTIGNRRKVRRSHAIGLSRHSNKRRTPSLVKENRDLMLP